MDAAFGHWLAGFLDGEGCFHLADRTNVVRGRTYRYVVPVFVMALRLDEAPIVREIQRYLGVGNIYVVAKEYKPNPDLPYHSKPTVRFQIQGKVACRRLVEVLTEFPLRAKKARDFEIWRAAVAEQAGRKDRATLIAYKEALVDIKRYDADAAEVELPPVAQLRLVEGT